jgi:hypothetical protein
MRDSSSRAAHLSEPQHLSSPSAHPLSLARSALPPPTLAKRSHEGKRLATLGLRTRTEAGLPMSTFSSPSFLHPRMICQESCLARSVACVPSDVSSRTFEPKLSALNLPASLGPRSPALACWAGGRMSTRTGCLGSLSRGFVHLDGVRYSCNRW